MSELPRRKQTRLPAYDYSLPGAYFVTICTRDRRCILSEITVGAGVLDGPRARLSAYGKQVEKTLLGLEQHYGFLTVDKYVIMPNHIHLLLRIEADGPSGTPAPTGRDERDAGGPSGTLAPTGRDEREADGPSGTPAPTGRDEREAGGPSGTPAPTNATLPMLISTLKRFSNKACGAKLWQRGYHEHVIRGEADYREIWAYIDENPFKWAEDRYYST